MGLATSSSAEFQISSALLSKKFHKRLQRSWKRLSTLLIITTVHLKLEYVALDFQILEVVFFLFLFSTQACPDFLIRLQTSKGETVFCSFLHYNSVGLYRMLTELMWTQSYSQREYNLNSTDDFTYIGSI